MSFGQRQVAKLRPVETAPEFQSVREERYECLIRVLIRHDRFGTASGLLRNFSVHGISGKVSATMHVGDQIEVYGKGFTSFLATIKWVQGGYFGAQLAEGACLDIGKLGSLAASDPRWGNRAFKSMSSDQVFGRSGTKPAPFGSNIFQKGKG